MNQFRRGASLLQKLGSLLAMLIWILFKIDIVQQANQTPKLNLLRIAQTLCIPSHYALYGSRMKKVKPILVIFF